MDHGAWQLSCPWIEDDQDDEVVKDQAAHRPWLVEYRLLRRMKDLHAAVLAAMTLEADCNSLSAQAHEVFGDVHEEDVFAEVLSQTAILEVLLSVHVMAALPWGHRQNDQAWFEVDSHCAQSLHPYLTTLRANH